MKHSMLMKRGQGKKEVATSYTGGERKANSFSRFGKKINSEAVIKENEQCEIESKDVEIQNNQASDSLSR